MVNKSRSILLGLLLASVAIIVVGTLFGSVVIPLSHFTHLSGYPSDTLIVHLRLSRTLTAYLIGALLALCGALMQVLLANPLADPYILGISSGSALASLGAILLGCGVFLIHLFAFAGGLVTFLFVLVLAGNKPKPESLLLIGVMLATCLAALISLTLLLSNNRELHTLLFWLIGSLSLAQHPLIPLVAVILGLSWSMRLATRLNLLAHGDEYARSLGLNVNPLRAQLLILTSLLTACAVSQVGAIGFIGLITPHFVRLITGNDHNRLLPMSVLLGGILLSLADTLARTLFAPMVLPVGLFTAFIGAPCFIFLLRRREHVNT